MSSRAGAALSRVDAADLPAVRKTRAAGEPRMSYDDRQYRAVFIICEQCQKPYYMTHPKPLCRDCTRSGSSDTQYG